MTGLLTQLRAWRRQEWLLDVAWAAARWVVLAVGVLFVAGLADWLIDRFADGRIYALGRSLRMPQTADALAEWFAGTPFLVRLLLSATGLLILSGGAYRFLVRLQAPSLTTLASRAEKAFPKLDHRLVTALQLNRPDAQTQGMSPQLIREVTREAESLSARYRYSTLIDWSRLQWALALVLPLMLILGAATALQPRLIGSLLGRQLLLPLAIPRSLVLENATAERWPSGDEVTLRILVVGPIDDAAEGSVRIFPEGQPSESFPLRFATRHEDGRAEFQAKVPPSSVPFRFRAWLQDARLAEPGRVEFVPRPIVVEVNAWVLLPRYVDPEGKNRYERSQPQGEVVALIDSSVRVSITTSKPVQTATVLLYARDDEGREQAPQRIPLTIDETGQSAGGVFDLPPRPSRYLIEVADEFGFTNANPPRRGITLAPDEPPLVKLLTETLKGPLDEGPLDDYEANGMPLALGGQVQIGYLARSPLGLARAQILYKVNDGPWSPLPLARVDADPAKVGRFVPELGLFERSGYNDQVEFFPLPSVDPEQEPPGLDAGGRYNFKTAALTKILDDGKTAPLQVGDRVEFYVEAFDRKPDPNRLGGRSESRLKTIVTQAQLLAWIDQHDQSRERLRKLEEGQRGIFGQPKK